MMMAAVRTACAPCPRVASALSMRAIVPSELEIDERRDPAPRHDRDDEDRRERDRDLERERARIVALLQRVGPSRRHELGARAENERARDQRRHGGAPARAGEQRGENRRT